MKVAGLLQLTDAAKQKLAVEIGCFGRFTCRVGLIVVSIALVFTGPLPESMRSNLLHATTFVLCSALGPGTSAPLRHEFVGWLVVWSLCHTVSF